MSAGRLAGREMLRQLEKRVAELERQLAALAQRLDETESK